MDLDISRGCTYIVLRNRLKALGVISQSYKPIFSDCLNQSRFMDHG